MPTPSGSLSHELAEKKAVADANAAKFGRSKAERQLSDAERSKAARELDGKKLDD
jgi:hypothetical protein